MQQIKFNIIGPLKNIIHPRLTEMGPGEFRAEFNVEVGKYLVDITANGRTIPGCPFTAKVHSVSMIRLFDVAEKCLVGNNYQFKVDASRAGEGHLEVSINDGKVSYQLQDLGNGQSLLSFCPEILGFYKIDIRFNGEIVPGSPVVVEATDLVEISSPQLVPVEGDLKPTLMSTRQREPVKDLSQLQEEIKSDVMKRSLGHSFSKDDDNNYAHHEVKSTDALFDPAVKKLEPVSSSQGKKKDTKDVSSVTSHNRPSSSHSNIPGPVTKKKGPEDKAKTGVPRKRNSYYNLR